MWLALDDVDPDNGPLRVVPRNHLLPGIDVRALVRGLFPDPATGEGWLASQNAVQQPCDGRAMQAQEVHVHAATRSLKISSAPHSPDHAAPDRVR